MIYYKNLSDPKINLKYMNALSTIKPFLECAVNYHTVNFDGHMVQLMMVEPYFICVHTKVDSVKSMMEDMGIDDVAEFELYLGDYFYDVGKGNSDGFLLDFDSSKPLYLDDAGLASKEHHIVGDTIILRVERRIVVKGDASCDWLVEAIDLRRFVKRKYNNDGFDYAVSNIDEQDVLIPFIDVDAKGIVFPEFNIDRQLLVEWLKHQFLKQVLKVSFEPFYERDGLIHKKHRGYGDKEPEYDLPASLVRFRESMAECDISRRFNDHEVF